MLTRTLAAVAVLLVAFAVNQYNRISQLQTQLAGARVQIAEAQSRGLSEARAAVAASMQGQGTEIEHVLVWLDDFYRSDAGLQRRQGLCPDGHPDFVGLSVWPFDIYIRNRLEGKSEEQARQAVADQIKGSAEWQSKHPQK